MARSTTFNAILYQNKLKEAGLESKIAEEHAKQLSDVISYEMATKQDIAMLKQEMEKVEYKMTIKLGSLVVGCTFIISLMIGVLGFILRGV